MIGGRYFLLIVILGLNLFAILMQGLRVNFLGELLIFVLFLIVSLIIITKVYKGNKYGLLTALFFIISILNLFYIKNALIVNSKVNVGVLGWLLFGITLLLNALGFIIGALSIKGAMTEEEKEEIIEKEIEPKIKEMQEKIESNVEKDNVKTEFYPGKFIASKTGSVYHGSKCEWAKKISKKNQIWFQDDKEAKKAGYKQHSCLKK
jgi:hypothetical protein